MTKIDKDIVSNMLLKSYADLQVMKDRSLAQEFPTDDFVADKDGWRSSLAEFICLMYTDRYDEHIRFRADDSNGYLQFHVYVWDHYEGVICAKWNPVDGKIEVLFQTVTTKQSLEKYMKESIPVGALRNRMGCSELWYDPFYVIKQTFTNDEVAEMSEKELERLIRALNNMSEGLY